MKHNSSMEIWNQNFTGNNLLTSDIWNIFGANSTTSNCTLGNSTCPLDLENLDVQDFPLARNSTFSSDHHHQQIIVGKVDYGGGHVGVPLRSSGASGPSGFMIISICAALVFLVIIVIFSILYLKKKRFRMAYS
uniref:Uncharacterized protein n=1 Tax=Romanomermis culicivorax TaxID=13658 RepID=A0A915JQB3_ROMCU